MRLSRFAAIFISLLLIILSCAGESEPEPSDPPEDQADEVTADTLEAVVTDSTDEAEQFPETEETVPAEAGLAGSWDTTMGKMELTADDAGNVTGEYPLGTI